MDKKILIRGAAIACAGIAVSTFAAQHILNKPKNEAMQISRPVANEQPQQILGAGLISSGSQISVVSSAPMVKAESVKVMEPELNLAALQDDGPALNLISGDDFAPLLKLADAEMRPAVQTMSRPSIAGQRADTCRLPRFRQSLARMHFRQ